MREITQFMKEYTPDDYSTIFRYLHVNKLSAKKDFLPLDIESLYETRTIVNGVEVTNEDKDIIIDYLRVNNIPVINRTYICARKKYLDGNFNWKIVEQQKQELTNRPKAKILVP